MDKLFDKKLIERVRCENDRRVVGGAAGTSFRFAA
jgi:hypothetical protein